MVKTDINNTTTTTLNSDITDYAVDSASIDEAGAGKTTEWNSPEWSLNLGYYKKIPELKKSIDALAMWACGKGWNALSTRDQILLENITGWGEDSFQSIMENMIVVKKVNGDSFAEIIRNEKGTLINLKPMNPSRVKVIVSEKGIIQKYEEWNGKVKIQTYQPSDILHLVNDRIANEIHGTSVIEACKWVIDARNEAMSDWRRLLHRSTIRVIEVDTDDATSLETIKTQYSKAIEDGEVMLLPKDNFSFPNAPIQYIDSQNWIRYLENFFYQAVGIPKIILGGSQEFTEASSKIGYLTFEQVYMREQMELESDLWNQLAVKVKFERPVSLKDEVVSSEAANTGQVGIQPNETQTGVTRNE